jgi:hypothetical protein
MPPPPDADRYALPVGTTHFPASRDEDVLVKAGEAARWLHMSADRLDLCRRWGGGPDYVRFEDGTIGYRLVDVRDFVLGAIVRALDQSITPERRRLAHDIAYRPRPEPESDRPKRTETGVPGYEAAAYCDSGQDVMLAEKEDLTGL